MDTMIVSMAGDGIVHTDAMEHAEPRPGLVRKGNVARTNRVWRP